VARVHWLLWFHGTITTSAHRPPTCTVYDKQHKRFCFQATHKDMRSSLKMAHGCQNMQEPAYQIKERYNSVYSAGQLYSYKKMHGTKIKLHSGVLSRYPILVSRYDMVQYGMIPKHMTLFVCCRSSSGVHKSQAPCPHAVHWSRQYVRPQQQEYRQGRRGNTRHCNCDTGLKHLHYFVQWK
jgi:hypothetical protein